MFIYNHSQIFRLKKKKLIIQLHGNSKCFSKIKQCFNEYILQHTMLKKIYFSGLMIPTYDSISEYDQFLAS